MKSARPCPTFSISRSSNNTSERQAAEVQVLRLGKKWKLMENNGKSASLDDISTSLVASNVNRKARRNSSFEVAATQGSMNEYEYKICIRLLSRKMLAVQVLQDILARSYTENTIYQKKLIIKIQTSNYAELNQNMYTVEHIITASSATMVSPGSSHRGSQALQRRAVWWALDPLCCNHRYKRSDF